MCAFQVSLVHRPSLSSLSFVHSVDEGRLGGGLGTRLTAGDGRLGGGLGMRLTVDEGRLGGAWE